MNKSNDQIIRIKHERQYMVISNYCLFNEPQMSGKSKNVLSTMLALPDGYNITIKGISSFMKDGICAIRSAMDELEEHKYLKRRKLRDEKGRFFGVEYTVYELPYTMLEGEQTEYKLAAKKEKAVSSAAPKCDFPNTEAPHTENRTQSNTVEKNIVFIKSVDDRKDIDTEKRNNCIDSFVSTAEVEQQINADELKQKLDDRFVDMVVEIITTCRNANSVRISGRVIPKDELHKRFAAITYDDVMNTANSARKRKAANPKAYIRAILFSGSYSQEYDRYNPENRINAFYSDYDTQTSSIDIDGILADIRAKYRQPEDEPEHPPFCATNDTGQYTRQFN